MVGFRSSNSASRADGFSSLKDLEALRRSMALPAEPTPDEFDLLKPKDVYASITSPGGSGHRGNAVNGPGASPKASAPADIDKQQQAPLATMASPNRVAVRLPDEVAVPAPAAPSRVSDERVREVAPPSPAPALAAEPSLRSLPAIASPLLGGGEVRLAIACRTDAYGLLGFTLKQPLNRVVSLQTGTPAKDDGLLCVGDLVEKLDGSRKLDSVSLAPDKGATRQLVVRRKDADLAAALSRLPPEVIDGEEAIGIMCIHVPMQPESAACRGEARLMLETDPEFNSVKVCDESESHGVRVGDIVLALDGRPLGTGSLPETIAALTLSGVLHDTARLTVFRPNVLLDAYPLTVAEAAAKAAEEHEQLLREESAMERQAREQSERQRREQSTRDRATHIRNAAAAAANVGQDDDEAAAAAAAAANGGGRPRGVVRASTEEEVQAALADASVRTGSLLKRLSSGSKTSLLKEVATLLRRQRADGDGYGIDNDGYYYGEEEKGAGPASAPYPDADVEERARERLADGIPPIGSAMHSELAAALLLYAADVKVFFGKATDVQGRIDRTALERFVLTLTAAKSVFSYGERTEEMKAFVGEVCVNADSNTLLWEQLVDALTAIATGVRQRKLVTKDHVASRMLLSSRRKKAVSRALARQVVRAKQLEHHQIHSGLRRDPRRQHLTDSSVQVSAQLTSLCWPTGRELVADEANAAPSAPLTVPEALDYLGLLGVDETTLLALDPGGAAAGGGGGGGLGEEESSRRGSGLGEASRKSPGRPPPAPPSLDELEAIANRLHHSLRDVSRVRSALLAEEEAIARDGGSPRPATLRHRQHRALSDGEASRTYWRLHTQMEESVEAELRQRGLRRGYVREATHKRLLSAMQSVALAQVDVPVYADGSEGSVQRFKTRRARRRIALGGGMGGGLDSVKGTALLVGTVGSAVQGSAVDGLKAMGAAGSAVANKAIGKRNVKHGTELATNLASDVASGITSGVTSGVRASTDLVGAGVRASTDLVGSGVRASTDLVEASIYNLHARAVDGVLGGAPTGAPAAAAAAASRERLAAAATQPDPDALPGQAEEMPVDMVPLEPRLLPIGYSGAAFFVITQRKPTYTEVGVGGRVITEYPTLSSEESIGHAAGNSRRENPSKEGSKGAEGDADSTASDGPTGGEPRRRVPKSKPGFGNMVPRVWDIAGPDAIRAPPSEQRSGSRRGDAARNLTAFADAAKAARRFSALGRSKR